MEEKKEIINYISTENNAKVDFCSSEKENGKCVNILSEEKVRIIYFNKKKSNLNSQNLWLSNSNIPHEIIIDISELNIYPKDKYNSFAIFCWHGHDSNPKTVEILISDKKNRNEGFLSLGIFELEIKAGKQVFPLDYSNIKDKNIINNVKSIKLLKIIIKENFGSDRTYINQIMLFEENSEIVKNFFIKQSQLSNQNNLINICNSNSQNSSLPESRNLGINDYKIIKNDKSKIQEYNKKNSKISMIKQNILDKETERQFDNNKKQNNSNKNIINVYKKKYSFLDSSSIQNNNKYTNTPNRYNYNNNKKYNNIPFNRITKNSNHIQSDRKREIDYERILANHLKDFDKQINLMSRENSFSGNRNKNNYLEQIFENKKYNYYNSQVNKNRRKINMKAYNKNDNNNSFVFNNNNRFFIPHSEDKTNKYMNYYQNDSNSYINNNLTKNPLFDLTSNNINDVNRRIENLEKYVFDIKKDISSMSNILSNLSKNNNIFRNNFRDKEQVREEYNEYFSEKTKNDENYKDNIKYRDSSNNNNDNHSMYSEFLSDENKKKNMNEFHKKYEIEINKKIDQKLQKLGEEIKNQIYDKFISPSIEQIENVMKQNIDEIKDRLNEIDYNNSLNNFGNNSFKKSKLLQSRSSYDLSSRRNSKIKNEKYKEINRLAEKLYQKLNLKAQKIKLLKEETAKYLKQK